MSDYQLLAQSKTIELWIFGAGEGYSSVNSAGGIYGNLYLSGFFMEASGYLDVDYSDYVWCDDLCDRIGYM
jgi:hypothetical protein